MSETYKRLLGWIVVDRTFTKKEQQVLKREVSYAKKLKLITSEDSMLLKAFIDARS